MKILHNDPKIRDLLEKLVRNEYKHYYVQKVKFLGPFDPQKGPKNGLKMKILHNDPKIRDLRLMNYKNEYKHYYVIFGPICPPKRAKNGHAQFDPLMGPTHKIKLLSCSIHYSELPCKKSAQTDKRFLRYSIFKNRAIWLAESLFGHISRTKSSPDMIFGNKIKNHPL